MAHTPGPWRVDTDAERVVTEYVDDKIEVHTGETSRQSDLRLIAAAPELLEACRAASGHTYPNLADADDLTESDAECWDMLRAAIAKAEGE